MSARSSCLRCLTSTIYNRQSRTRNVRQMLLKRGTGAETGGVKYNEKQDMNLSAGTRSMKKVIGSFRVVPPLS